MPNEPRWRRYLRFHRQNTVADIDDELRDHLQSTIDSLVSHGMTADDARVEAHRRFGDVDHVRKEVRRLEDSSERTRSVSAWIGSLRDDLVFASRQLRRAPGFAAVAALSIALGVGLNVAIFSLANGVLLRPLPGVRVDGLQRLYQNHHSGFQWRDLEWLRDHATLLESVVGERLMPISMEAGDNPERITAAFVSRGFFQMLGVRMTLGRAFDVDERQPGEAVIVLSNATWRTRFGGDSSIIGRSVRLSGHSFTVIGIAAPEFASSVFGWAPAMWLPLADMPFVSGVSVDKSPGTFYATVRLRAGTEPGAAGAELAGLAKQLYSADTTRFKNFSVRLDGMRGVNAELRAPAQAATGFLLAMVAMVLVIACANVANLLLGRASARRTEIAVRLAIGASPSRIVRQLFTESLMLAAIGVGLGLAVASTLVHLVVSVLPEAGLSLNFAPDRNVFFFALVVAAGSVVLFGLAPAKRAVALSLTDALRGDADNFGGRKSRARGVLIGGQVALCAVLLATASMLSESFVRSRNVDPGFSTTGIQDLQLDLDQRIDTLAGIAELDRIVAALSALHAVEGVALAQIVPLSGSNMATPFALEDVSANAAALPSTYFNVVGPAYFSTLGIKLTRGRDFQKTDIPGAPPVALVNETAAHRWWPNADPIGKRLYWGGVPGTATEIVGVVRDAKYNTYGEDPTPFVYLPVAQNYSSQIVAHVRVAAGGPTPASLRAAVRAIDPMVPSPSIKPLHDEIALALLPSQLGAALLGVFGVVALILAASGIYGVTSYAVSRRTREIGIRSALGASRGRILRSVVGDGTRTAAIGGAVGLAFAVGIGALLSRVLYGVSAIDPVMLVGVPIVLGLVVVGACIVPARRAAGVDPVTAMRSE